MKNLNTDNFLSSGRESDLVKWDSVYKLWSNLKDFLKKYKVIIH